MCSNFPHSAVLKTPEGQVRKGLGGRLLQSLGSNDSGLDQGGGSGEKEAECIQDTFWRHN